MVQWPSGLSFSFYTGNVSLSDDILQGVDESAILRGLSRNPLMRLPTMIALPALLLCACCHASAQEVECSIQVNSEGLSSTHADKLRNFASDIKEYVSHYNWGGATTDDRITCTLNIFFKTAVGENRYVAQVFVGSQRPIYKSEQNTAVVRIFDDYWEFTYLRERPLSHNQYAFNDLTGFLDFYMYLIAGYDADTYEKTGGTPMFQKAADIANLGRSSGAKDWQATTGSYSRGQLAEELLNPKFEPVRSAFFTYHFAGLDSLAFNRDQARRTILKAAEFVGMTRRQVDNRNLVIKTFFDSKYMELANLFLDYPDPNVYLLLSRIDPVNQSTYEAYRAKRQ
jgi:hypothetical protein